MGVTSKLAHSRDFDLDPALDTEAPFWGGGGGGGEHEFSPYGWAVPGKC